MAGGGEKKRAKEAEETRKLYTNITIAIYIVWFSVRVLWGWSTVTAGTIVGVVFLSAINYLCLTSIFKALSYGTPYSLWQDVLFINWFVQALVTFTSYGWYVWLVIPAYGLYQYGPMLLGWARMFMGGMGGGGGGGGGGTGEPTEADIKRQAKKERQADRASKFQGK